MEFAQFLLDQWGAIKASPSPFVFVAAIVGPAGFAFAKLFYGSAAESAKAAENLASKRLDSALDDLQKFEQRKAEQSDEISFLKTAVEGLRQSLANVPTIYHGEKPPESGVGKPGDIFFQTEPAPTVADDKSKSSTQTSTLQSPASLANLPSAGLFITPPKTTLSEALRDAALKSKPIFAVIYDPEHPSKSKLAYSLGYFLEYATTRKLVDDNFVCAMFSVQDEGIINYVPDDDPLENCRMVILSQEGRLLHGEGVYANPDEGLQRTRAAIALASPKH